MRLLLAALFLILTPAMLAADPRERLGYGRLVNNDFYGDGHDRGHSADVQASWVWGPAWQGRAPERPGALLELRFNAGVLTPANLRNPQSGDRPYAGYLGLGLHTHVASGAVDWSAGLDLIATGPQTRLGEIQTALHDGLFGVPPSPQVLRDQVGNGFHPSLTVEMGREIALGDRAILRPFIEGRAGFETLIRGGVDLTLGRITRGDLMVRDMVTGQSYRAVRTGGGGSGLALVLGADVARVRASVLLPADRGYVLTPARVRARAGVHWQGRRGDGFYGITWLGPEFEGQPTDQLVGSLRLNFRF